MLRLPTGVGIVSGAGPRLEAITSAHARPGTCGPLRSGGVGLGFYSPDPAARWLRQARSCCAASQDNFQAPLNEEGSGRSSFTGENAPHESVYPDDFPGQTMDDVITAGSSMATSADKPKKTKTSKRKGKGNGRVKGGAADSPAAAATRHSEMASLPPNSMEGMEEMLTAARETASGIASPHDRGVGHPVAGGEATPTAADAPTMATDRVAGSPEEDVVHPFKSGVDGDGGVAPTVAPGFISSTSDSQLSTSELSEPESAATPFTGHPMNDAQQRDIAVRLYNKAVAEGGGSIDDWDPARGEGVLPTMEGHPPSASLPPSPFPPGGAPAGSAYSRPPAPTSTNIPTSATHTPPTPGSTASDNFSPPAAGTTPTAAPSPPSSSPVHHMPSSYDLPRGASDPRVAAELAGAYGHHSGVRAIEVVGWNGVPPEGQASSTPPARQSVETDIYPLPQFMETEQDWYESTPPFPGTAAAASAHATDAGPRATGDAWTPSSSGCSTGGSRPGGSGSTDRGMSDRDLGFTSHEAEVDESEMREAAQYKGMEGEGDVGSEYAREVGLALTPAEEQVQGQQGGWAAEIRSGVEMTGCGGVGGGSDSPVEDDVGVGINRGEVEDDGGAGDVVRSAVKHPSPLDEGPAFPSTHPTIMASHISNSSPSPSDFSSSNPPVPHASHTETTEEAAAARDIAAAIAAAALQGPTHLEAHLGDHHMHRTGHPSLTTRAHYSMGVTTDEEGMTQELNTAMASCVDEGPDPLLSHMADTFARSGSAAALGPRAMRLNEGLPIHGSVHGGGNAGDRTNLSGVPTSGPGLCYPINVPIAMSAGTASVAASSTPHSECADEPPTTASSSMFAHGTHKNGGYKPTAGTPPFAPNMPDTMSGATNAHMTPTSSPQATSMPTPHPAAGSDDMWAAQEVGGGGMHDAAALETFPDASGQFQEGLVMGAMAGGRGKSGKRGEGMVGRPGVEFTLGAGDQELMMRSASWGLVAGGCEKSDGVGVGDVLSREAEVDESEMREAAQYKGLEGEGDVDSEYARDFEEAKQRLGLSTRATAIGGAGGVGAGSTHSGSGAASGGVGMAGVSAVGGQGVGAGTGKSFTGGRIGLDAYASAVAAGTVHAGGSSWGGGRVGDKGMEMEDSEAMMAELIVASDEAGGSGGLAGEVEGVGREGVGRGVGGSIVGGGGEGVGEGGMTSGGGGREEVAGTGSGVGMMGCGEKGGSSDSPASEDVGMGPNRCDEDAAAAAGAGGLASGVSHATEMNHPHVTGDTGSECGAEQGLVQEGFFNAMGEQAEGMGGARADAQRS